MVDPENQHPEAAPNRPPEPPSTDTPQTPPGAESPTSTNTPGAIARLTRRLDLTTCVLIGGTTAILELGGALAKRGYDASDTQVALLTSAQGIGLVASFVIAHFAVRGRKMPLVFAGDLLRSVPLLCVFFVKTSAAFGFVVCHALAQIGQTICIPARVTIYRLNYPARLRGRWVGANRRVQVTLATVVALVLTLILDWSAGAPDLVRWLGPASIDVESALQFAIPAIGVLGVIAALTFRRIPVLEQTGGEASATPAPRLRETAKQFWTIWREDRAFRRYELYFMFFGAANIMAMPLTQIHAVEVFDANYAELALINVVLPQGFMAATMVYWGRHLDRQSPARLRGILNMIFAFDFLALALAPSLGWIYLGRVCRGVALGGGTLVWFLGALHYAKTPQLAPVYSGIHTVLTGVRWLLAPFVGIWLKNLFRDDARPVFFVCALAVLIAGVGLLREARRESS